MGRDRRAALRPRLPPRLPPDRQPARRRGPHPGGLRPGVPLPRRPTRPARSRAGCTGSPPTSSSTRPAASSGSASTRSPTSGPSRLTSAVAGARRGVRRPHLRRRRRAGAGHAAAGLPRRRRAVRRRGPVLRGDRRDPRRQARHRPLPDPPRPRDAAHARWPTARPAPAGSRYSGPVDRPIPSGGRVVIGHLGSRVSALLDGQLSPAEAERAWAHVHACHACRDLVEREGWVKTRLAGLSFGRRPRRPTTSRARCSARRVAVRRLAAACSPTRRPRAAQRRAGRARRRRRRRRRRGRARARASAPADAPTDRPAPRRPASIRDRRARPASPDVARPTPTPRRHGHPVARGRRWA